MAITLEISNHTRTRLPIVLLENACKAALASGRQGRAQVELHLVGDARMRSFNREYLKHDYTTDVLSFDLGKTKDLGLVAMLVVCIPYARREAKTRGLTLEEELVRYVIHGTLHLLGHDDHDEKDYKRMWAAQEKLVQVVMKKTTQRRKY